MNTKVEKIENNVVKLEVTVSAEKFNDAVKKAYKKNANKFNVPGFRKGKTPLSVVEKYYGDSVFFEDAINIVCDDTYPNAVEENKISPVDYPEIDVVQIGKDVDFIYTAKVVVKPEVKLGDYKGIEVKKVEYPVTDEDVEEQLNVMREKNARIINKEDGKVEDGDIAVIDFEGFVDGVAFEGGKGENYELTIGSGSFIPGFEDQVKGASINETVDVNVTFPEDYREESLKGKPALFKVKINEIKYKELPELDDEFAKDVSEFATLDELKDDLKKKQAETNALREKKDFEDEAVKAVVNNATIDLPHVMIDREIDYMIKDLDYRLRYQGLELEQYVQLMGITVDALKEDFHEVAEAKVRTNLVLEAIAKAENIFATDEEVDAKAEEIAKQYGAKDAEKLKASIMASEKAIIEEEIVNNKVVDFLVKESKEIA